MRVHVILICAAIIVAVVFEGGFSRTMNEDIVNQPDSYLAFSTNTDPGEYIKLYEKLPDDLAELCALIKKQMIHPTRIGDFPELEGLGSEDTQFYSVKEMLAELVKRNPSGLVISRAPKERLRVSCRFHAMLLASILKSKKIPARVRVGFAPYLVPPGYDKSVDHWICEVWNKDGQRWMLVDPDIQKIDFPRPEFEFAGDVWLKLRSDRDGERAGERYGVGQWWGREYVKANLLHDLFCVMNNELIYWEGCELARKSIPSMDKSDLALLDNIAKLLKNPDENYRELKTVFADKRLGDVKDHARYE
ncbi:MAG TPA: transglutaminase family protein [Spirochaetota bacterium]|nr:transglutaminase family protein [Spirochaetota bacterium]